MKNITPWTALAALSFAFLSACSTTPKKESTAYTPSAPVPAEPESGRIDYNAIQTHLNLDRPAEQLGYSEKAFNTCEMGYGYSRSQNCHKEYFVVIHFRLLCRDSEGTISTVLTDADLTPIAGKDVRWNLKGVSGTLLTDGLGYGQIRTVSSSSQVRQRLKVAVGNEFLYMRANEINKVITPRPWCNQ